MKLGRNAQTLEDLAGSRLEAVAVEAQDEILDLGVSLAVEVLGGCLENPFLFGQGAPQFAMTHHRHLEDRSFFEAEMILREHPEAQTFGQRDPTFARLLIAGDDP